jgi:hypothetical protein
MSVDAERRASFLSILQFGDFTIDVYAPLLKDKMASLA